MFQINPNIPLQELANPVNFADALTKAQENQLFLQALRDEYNAAKEERDAIGKKQYVKVWLASCKKCNKAHQRNIALHFPQTMPTGQNAKRHDRCFSIRTWPKVTAACIVW